MSQQNVADEALRRIPSLLYFPSFLFFSFFSALLVRYCYITIYYIIPIPAQGTDASCLFRSFLPSPPTGSFLLSPSLLPSCTSCTRTSTYSVLFAGTVWQELVRSTHSPPAPAICEYNHKLGRSFFQVSSFPFCHFFASFLLCISDPPRGRSTLLLALAGHLQLPAKLVMLPSLQTPFYSPRSLHPVDL